MCDMTDNPCPPEASQETVAPVRRRLIQPVMLLPDVITR